MRIRSVRVLSYPNVELAVRAKVDRAAVVIGRASQIFKLENNGFTPSSGHVAVGGETANAIMGSRDSVIDIDKLVGGKIWIESHSQESPLAV